MTNEELMRRIRNGEDVEHVLDIKFATDRAEFRAWLVEEAKINPRVDLEDWDRKMRELDLGIDRAKMVWHSISATQRRVLFGAITHGGRMERVGKEYRASKGRHQPYVPAYVATIRPLCSRDLMAWDGGAFDPEATAVVTERGRFVVAHGGWK